jgi:hypothetical protein
VGTRKLDWGGEIWTGNRAGTVRARPAAAKIDSETRSENRPKSKRRSTVGAELRKKKTTHILMQNLNFSLK